MKFKKYVDLDHSLYPEITSVVEQIALNPRVEDHRAWYGPLSGFEGWHVRWSMSHVDEETNPESDIIDAYGNAISPEGLVFWWKRQGDDVKISQCARVVGLEIG